MSCLADGGRFGAASPSTPPGVDRHAGSVCAAELRLRDDGEICGDEGLDRDVGDGLARTMGDKLPPAPASTSPFAGQNGCRHHTAHGENTSLTKFSPRTTPPSSEIRPSQYARRCQRVNSPRVV